LNKLYGIAVFVGYNLFYDFIDFVETGLKELYIGTLYIEVEGVGANFTNPHTLRRDFGATSRFLRWESGLLALLNRRNRQRFNNRQYSRYTSRLGLG
jgi:hypothetical protein